MAITREFLDDVGPRDRIRYRFTPDRGQIMELSFEFAKGIFDDPTILDEIPEGATLVLLPADDPGLAREKQELGMRALDRGENVYFRHVKSLKAAP